MAASNQEDCATPPEIPFSNVTVAVASGGAAPSRRLPPPCWSLDETGALIDAYRDKWYSLRRGNLRANHWQEVAEEIAVKCPVNPPKTSMQCRHKMEKLRKRYRAEKQRVTIQRAQLAASYGGAHARRYCSNWIHFKRMDAMERGPDAASPPPEDEDESEDEQDDFKQNSVKHIGDIYNQHNLNSNKRKSFQQSMSNGGAGIRIRIPSARPIPTPPMAKSYSKIDEMLSQIPNSNSNPNHGVMKKEKAIAFGKRIIEEVGEKRKADPIAEAVTAINMLGEGLVRMESMKMEVARELEQMKMEMEMKKTEMILESQQRIVEAFAMAYSEKNTKKAKRMPTPECD